ncbi:MAG TPA: hypothetical protein VGF65_11205 [Mycobacterium sp.]|jgi:hypothetical protein
MTFSAKLLVSLAAHALVAATLLAGGAHAQVSDRTYTGPVTAPLTTACPVGPTTTTVAACTQAMQRAGWTPCGDTGAMCPPAAKPVAPAGSFKYGSKTIYPYAMQPGWRMIGSPDVLGGTVNTSFIDPQGHVFACIANIGSWTGGDYCVAIP